MKEKLFDSEAKVMEILWQNGPLCAKQVSLIAADSIGWNKNTTYTVLKKLEAKGFIRRQDPGFVCTPLISRQQMQRAEALFSALLEEEPLSEEEAQALRKLIEGR